MSGDITDQIVQLSINMREECSKHEEEEEEFKIQLIHIRLEIIASQFGQHCSVDSTNEWNFLFLHYIIAKRKLSLNPP